MRTKMIKLALSVGTALIATPHAYAQGSASDAASAADTDIIVTARRKEEVSQDVPLVVNAVTSQRLEKLNIRDFKDIASVVPGLTLIPAANGIAPGVTLRGVDNQVAGSANNGTVQFYQNDATIGAAALFNAMYDIGQIEILRGPQGTLRGIAAPSGSITVTTRRPDLNSIGGYVMGTANTIGGINVNGAVNVPIIKGLLAVRVAGIVNDDEANRVISINNPGAVPYARTRGERVSVLLSPIDNLEITGIYQHFLRKSQLFPQVMSAGLAFGTPVAGIPITAQSRQGVTAAPLIAREVSDRYNVQVQYSLAGQKLNYVGSWAKQDNTNQDRSDQSGYFVFNGFPGNSGIDPLVSANLLNYGRYTDSFSKAQFHELRLSSEERLFGVVDYVIGGMINRNFSSTPTVSQTPVFCGPLPSPATAPNLCARGAVTQSNLVLISSRPGTVTLRTLERSIYGNVTVHIGDATEISGGLRYIHFNNFANFTGTGTTDDFKTTVYTASLKHRFGENVMAYASIGSSWRINGGTNGAILQSSGNLFTADPNLATLYKFTPETSRSYEIGVKTDWLDKRLRLNVSYFHQDFSNYIYTTSSVTFRPCFDPTGVTCTAINGAGFAAGPNYPQVAFGQAGLTTSAPVKVDGVEAEFFFAPTHNLNIGGNISYALGKISNGRVPCNIDPAHPLTGIQQINLCTVNQRSSPTSPFSATMQTEFLHEITGSIGGFARGQLTLFGNSQNDPLNPYDNVKSYALVNLFLGIQDSHGAWEVTAYAKNIFNTYRKLSVGGSPLGAFYVNAFTQSPTTVLGNYAAVTSTAPREFGITARFSFGSH